MKRYRVEIYMRKRKLKRLNHRHRMAQWLLLNLEYYVPYENYRALSMCYNKFISKP